MAELGPELGVSQYMRTLTQDLKYAFRMLAKNPAFTAIAVLTLALGIGINTAMFSVVNAVLIRPLPFPQSDRIVLVMRHFQDGSNQPAVSVPMILDWRNHNKVFDALGAFQIFPVGFNLSQGDQPERINGIHVTAGFFPVLGIKPVAGRVFSPEEDQPGGPGVVVISNNLWRNRFGAAPDIIGKTITLSNETSTVIGIMPEGFQFPPRVELWAPLRLPATSQDPGNLYPCIARLKDGVTLKTAGAAISTLYKQFRKDNPGLDSGPDVAVSPLQEQLVGNIRPVLLVLLAAVCFVLLIACVNVANLLLARSAARQREVAIRTAMGAGRFRLMRQLLTESVLLGLMGGTLGLFTAYWGIGGLLSLAPPDLPLLHDVGIDANVLGFTLGASLLTGILFGLGPALRLSGGSLSETLKEGSRGSTEGRHRQRTRSVLVVSEIALSLVLVVGAGLLIESFVRLRDVKPGFDPRNVLTFQMSLPESKYSKPETFSLGIHQLLQRMEAIPGVQFAATVTTLPLEMGPDLPFDIEGRVPKNPGEPIGDSQYRTISPTYFQALGTPLLHGRYFTENDTGQSAGVVIINDAMARQYWPNQDPIGQRMTIGRVMGPAFADSAPRQVVGVVGDFRDMSLGQPAQATMFVPYTQIPASLVGLMVREIPSRWIVRTAGNPAGMSPAIQREVLTVDRSQPLANIRTMDQVVSQSIAGNQFNMVLLGIFAGLALLLAAVGLYGVMSYSVEQRTHDIGIRMALGARTADVLKLVVGQGMILAVIGVGLGVLGSVALTRFMASMLYGVRPNDPFTLVAVSLALIGVALTASYIPAWRATKVDPIVALRYE
jgi:putative ABC transport system permease protein